MLWWMPKPLALGRGRQLAAGLGLLCTLVVAPRGCLLPPGHPNIVEILEAFEDSRFVYIIMEQCKGGSCTTGSWTKGATGAPPAEPACEPAKALALRGDSVTGPLHYCARAALPLRLGRLPLPFLPRPAWPVQRAGRGSAGAHHRVCHWVLPLARRGAPATSSPRTSSSWTPRRSPRSRPSTLGSPSFKRGEEGSPGRRAVCCQAREGLLLRPMAGWASGQRHRLLRGAFCEGKGSSPRVEVARATLPLRPSTHALPPACVWHAAPPCCAGEPSPPAWLAAPCTWPRRWWPPTAATTQRPSTCGAQVRNPAALRPTLPLGPPPEQARGFFPKAWGGG